jgi:hypothetical protein
MFECLTNRKVLGYVGVIGNIGFVLAILVPYLAWPSYNEGCYTYNCTYKPDPQFSQCFWIEVDGKMINPSCQTCLGDGPIKNNTKCYTLDGTTILRDDCPYKRECYNEARRNSYIVYMTIVCILGFFVMLVFNIYVVSTFLLYRDYDQLHDNHRSLQTVL